MVLAFACTGFFSPRPHGLWLLSGFSGLLVSPRRSRGISLMQLCQLTGHVVSVPEKVLIEGLLGDAADYELWFQLGNAWRGVKWSEKQDAGWTIALNIYLCVTVILRLLIQNTMMHMWIVVKPMVIDVYANNRTKQPTDECRIRLLPASNVCFCCIIRHAQIKRNQPS